MDKQPDAQEDNGIPVLTYHHILRDEENTRFRHTSTTTSVRAFSNQMTGFATGVHHADDVSVGRLRAQQDEPAREGGGDYL